MAPSYGVPLTPFKTASQCSRSSSSTGPRCSRASLGDLEYSLSSLRRRCVVDVEAILYNRYIDMVWNGEVE